MYNNSSSSSYNNIYIIQIIIKIKSVILQVLIIMFLILNYQLVYDFPRFPWLFKALLNQSLYKSSLKTHFYSLAFEWCRVRYIR